MKIKKTVNIIGCGFAGIECALFLASHGINVHIFCDKQSSYKCDCITCENLGRNDKNKSYARDLLREELIILRSKLIEEECKLTKNGLIECGCVASRLLQKAREILKEQENVKIFELNVKELDTEEINVVATGPHTSKELFEWLKTSFGSMRLIDDCYENPIVTKVDKDFLYKKEGDESEDLYLPLSYHEYIEFCNEIVKAHNEYLDLSGSKKLESGELTIEKLIDKGKDGLKNHAFRECKLVGFNERPYAVIRFKKHELGYEICGLVTEFPNNIQDRFIYFLTACYNCQVVRYSRVMRSSYINSPYMLNKDCQANKYNNIFFAGSIIGLEGHLEAMASGIVTGMNVLAYIYGKKFLSLPQNTMICNLLRKIVAANASKFSPLIANYDIIEEYEKGLLTREEIVSRAKLELFKFMEDLNGR